MAKPNPLDDPDSAPKGPHRRRRPVAHRPNTCPAPSAAVLSVLAGIVANSAVAAAGPAPPPFLCPSLARPPPASTSLQAPSPFPSHRPPSRRTDTSSKYSKRDRILPFKFEQGDDGVWRHVESYTLYGSTVCSQTCQPTSPVNADEATSGSNSTDSIDPVDLEHTLPSGWLPVPERNEDKTTLILSLSLVLAFFICFFMIGCLFWRKNVRLRYKADDPEMTARKRRSTLASAVSSPALDEERRSKVKQKIWTRATARWKDHARYTARLRRRKRPVSTRSQPLDSTTTLNPPTPLDLPADDVSSTSTPLTPTQSRTVSLRPSSISLRVSSPSSVHLPQESTENSSTPTSLSIHLPHDDDLSPTPSSPPAYRRGTLLTPIIIPSQGLSVSDEHGINLRVPTPRSSHSSLTDSSLGPKSSFQPLESECSSISHLHAAHVATDDKSILARLADLAERPPETDIDDAETSHQVSVPVWQDEQLSDFTREPEFLDVDTSYSSIHCPFPPPPSKGKMAEASFYTYRSSFEEFTDSIDPELEPSAPPFEAPSAPGLGDVVMLPSAPPLTEDESPLEVYPHAPHLEPSVEDDDAQDSASVDSQRGTDHQSAATLRPISGGTLPGYHP